jgi:glycerate kinase
MNILVVPNAFKGSLSAREAGAIIQKGLRQSNASYQIKNFAIADGGDGTLDVLTEYLGLSIRTQKVQGPLGQPVEAKYAQDGKKALIELAEASGIRLVNSDELDPWNATTFGTGELIRSCIESGCKEIYFTVGGSATVDCGLGILSALGFKFYAEEELIEQPTPSDFCRITRIDDSKVPSGVWDTNFSVLVDVTNPLLGSEGAVRVFGPQKGVDKEMIDEFEEHFEWFGQLLNNYSKSDICLFQGGGASGGVPAGLLTFCHGQVVNGGEFVLDTINFDQHLRWADLVITTEGMLDGQTAFGKGPGLVATKAKAAKRKVIALCGQVGKDFSLSDSPFTSVLSINTRLSDLKEAMKNTADNLELAAFNLGRLVG